jgi:serine/threonine protein kinase
MELCEKGSLRSCLKSTYMPWKLRVRLALDVAWGLVFLHENNIMHRDVKTGNVLVDRHWRAKLCDMAFACHRSSPVKMKLTCGTEEFMAPEISLAYDCDLPADIFSFGIMLCEIMTGKEPGHEFLFRKAQTKFEVREDEIRNHLLPDCPEGLEALAYQCCDSEPRRRPNILQVIEELETVLMDLGGEDFTYTNDNQEMVYRQRRVSQSSDTSFAGSSDVIIKLGLMESQLNDLRLENLRLAAELSELKSSTPSTSVTTSNTISVDPEVIGNYNREANISEADVVACSPTFGHILKNISILEQRIQRIESMQGNQGNMPIYYPTTLDSSDLAQPIPADLWGHVGKVMNTLLGLNKRLEYVENMAISPRSDNASSAGDESEFRGNQAPSPNTWQSVSEFLAATVAAQKQLDQVNSNADDGSSVNRDEQLSSAVDSLHVDSPKHNATATGTVNETDAAKQLLSSLGSFLSSVGLYASAHGSNGSNVLDEVDRALLSADPSRAGVSKRGHSDMTANNTSSQEVKGTIRTPKISRLVGASIQEGVSKHPPIRNAISAQNSPRSLGTLSKTSSNSSSNSRSTSRGSRTNGLEKALQAQREAEKRREQHVSQFSYCMMMQMS